MRAGRSSPFAGTGGLRVDLGLRHQRREPRPRLCGVPASSTAVTPGLSEKFVFSRV